MGMRKLCFSDGRTDRWKRKKAPPREKPLWYDYGEEEKRDGW